MEVIKILGQANPQTTEEILYIVPANKGCVISQLNIVNRDYYDATINIKIGSAENIEYNPEITWVEQDMLIYSKCSSQRLKGITLAAGDIVQITSSTDFISFSLFGSEFDQNFSYDGDNGNGDYGYGYGEIVG
jgi:hypothetical protein